MQEQDIVNSVVHEKAFSLKADIADCSSCSSARNASLSAPLWFGRIAWWPKNGHPFDGCVPRTLSFWYPSHVPGWWSDWDSWLISASSAWGLACPTEWVCWFFKTTFLFDWTILFFWSIRQVLEGLESSGMLYVPNSGFSNNAATSWRLWAVTPFSPMAMSFKVTSVSRWARQTTTSSSKVFVTFWSSTSHCCSSSPFWTREAFVNWNRAPYSWERWYSDHIHPEQPLVVWWLSPASLLPPALSDAVHFLCSFSSRTLQRSGLLTDPNDSPVRAHHTVTLIALNPAASAGGSGPKQTMTTASPHRNSTCPRVHPDNKRGEKGRDQSGKETHKVAPTL